MVKCHIIYRQEFGWKGHGGMKKKHKTKTLQTRMLLSILLVALLQILMVVVIIELTGTTRKLDESTMQIYKNAVYNRGENVEERLKNWSSIEPYYTEVTATVSKKALRKYTTVQNFVQNKENRRELLVDVSEVAKRCIDELGVTDCFIIFQPGIFKKKECLYLRKDSDSDEILLERGPRRAMTTKEIILADEWQEKLMLQGDTDYYVKPLLMAYDHPDTSADQLGYFSEPFQMADNLEPMITYTIPLWDDNHKPYGIMGVGINLETLKELLPSEELSIDINAAYCLGITQDGTTFRTVAVHGGEYEKVLEKQPVFTLEQHTVGGFSTTNGLGDIGNFDFYYYPFHLYENNSLYGDDIWVLGAFASYGALHASSQRLLISLLVALSMSLGISIVIAVVISNNTSRPLVSLVNALKDLSPQRLRLPRTDIREIDELAREVERQSFAAYKAGNKIADIIQLSSLRLGMWEYQEDSDKIFCTEKIFDIFRVPKGDWKDNYMSRHCFDAMVENIISNAVADEDEKNVYLYTDPKGKEKYVQLREKKDERSWLCIVTDVTMDMMEKKKIKHERDYDMLTNLYNRRAFSRIVQGLIATGKVQNALMSIWDLDNLKYVNDTFGHEMGDKYICQLADYFSRLADETCVVARMSGDEFLVFMDNRPKDEMVERLRKVHQNFCKEKLYLPDGNLMSVSASAGMSFYPEDSRKYKELIQYADFAMYEIKKSSKGGISSFDLERYVRDNILVNGVGELNRILEEESVSYVFQPIISVKECKVFAYEALMHPVSDTVHNATELIRLAESQSKLGVLEKITWFHSIRTFAKFYDADNPCHMFLNSMPNQCLKPEEFKQLEEEYGSLLGQIVVEMTENTKVDEAMETTKSAWCKQWHIPLALDDFGSGYSNSDILVSRQFDFVKLDMSLIQNIHLYPSTQDLVKHIIDYCHANGQMVIAEGVEKKEELSMVISMGVDYLQGFLLGRADSTLSQPDLTILRQVLSEIQ